MHLIYSAVCMSQIYSEIQSTEGHKVFTSCFICGSRKRALTEEMDTWFWILGWFLSILTIAGNGFIIFLVGSRRQLRTKTNAFVVSLAVADFCVGLSVIPFPFFCGSSCKWLGHGASWLKIVRWLFGYASVMNLCSLVLDRYIAVVKPLKYLTLMTSRRVKQMIFFSWAIPVGIDILPLSSRISSKPVFMTIFKWLVIILFEFSSCVMLIFFVGSMIHVVLKQRRARAARMLANELRLNHRVPFKTHEKATVKIMAIVVGLFLLCYGIYIRCTIVGVVYSANCEDAEYKLPILVLNSAVNPLVYALLKRDINNEFKKVTYVVTFKRGK